MYAGLYIHIPFCIKKCPYCSFYSVSDLFLKDSFLKALYKEMSMLSSIDLTFDTIYIGGGTPSILDEKDIDNIIQKANKCFRIANGSEITIEANPGTINFQKLEGYRKSGINRISIGVQSFQNPNLKFLGRIHTGKESSTAVENSQKAGFDNIGIDFIYGLPDQKFTDFLHDLEKAIKYSVAHISCYILSFEEGTILFDKKQKGEFKSICENQLGDMFEDVISFLNSNGYHQYEISNFSCSKAFRSRHNLKYWSFSSYIGLGPSAHSFISAKRYWNFRCIEKYIDNINKKKLPIDEIENIDINQHMIEAIYLGLRQTKGIDITDFEKTSGYNFNNIFKKLLTELKTDDLLNITDNKCSLTLKGMRFLDSIASMFVSHLP